MDRLRRSIRSFANDESGIIMAEALLLLPMMIWGFVALVVYWDVFRTINISQKAAYSIADLLSRQVVVTTNFIDGLQEVVTFLTPGAQESRIRITSFEFFPRRVSTISICLGVRFWASSTMTKALFSDLPLA